MAKYLCLPFSAHQSINREYAKIWQKLHLLFVLMHYSACSSPLIAERISHEFLPHLKVTQLDNIVYSLAINIFLVHQKGIFSNHNASKEYKVLDSTIYPGQCSTKPNIVSLPAGKIYEISLDITKQLHLQLLSRLFSPSSQT